MRVSVRYFRIACGLLRAAWAALPLVLATASAHSASVGRVAPEFSHPDKGDWINSQPRSMAALRGQVVLIEFWTFDCVNCRRTLPWLKTVQQRYGKDGLVIVGVHTPELRHEQDPANVRAAVTRLGISYPVLLDNDFSYWNAMGNRYWPAFYLIDRQGRIVATQIGELHEGQARADEYEAEIRRRITQR